MPCKGLHCGGCRGGGGIGLAVIVAVVLVIAAAGKAIAEAARVISAMLEVAAIALAVSAAVLAAVMLARLGLRIRDRRGTPAAAAVPRVTYQAVPVDNESLEIEPPRPRLTGIADLDFAHATLPHRTDSCQNEKP